MQRISNGSMLDHFRNKISHLDQKVNKNEKFRNFLSHLNGNQPISRMAPEGFPLIEIDRFKHCEKYLKKLMKSEG